jgi:dephospho-CoA kinase
MLKVGLTGGYASGKSFVAAELARLGCHIIYADQLGHAVLLPDGEAYAPVLQEFGPEILEESGSVDRKKLASIVFKSPKLLHKLESYVHPAVFRLEERIVRGFEDTDPHGIAVVEAAILIETGRYPNFDRLVLTVCDEDVRIARAMHRDHLTRDQVVARLTNQMTDDEKKKYAHYVVNTNRSKEATAREVEQIYRELQGLAA